MARDAPEEDGQNPIDLASVGFVPTVHDHTRYEDGFRLHTIDPDPDRDIETFNDDRQPRFVGQVEQ